MHDVELRAASGNRLGEYALVAGGSYRDFTMRLRAKAIRYHAMADYAVVFGFQDENNYLYLMANADQAYSGLFAVEDGERTVIAETDGALVADTAWHTLELERDGQTIVVRLDDEERLRTTTELFPSGRLGIGVLNDAALFDDVEIIDPSAPGSDAGHADAEPNDAGSSIDGADDPAASGQKIDATGGCGCKTTPGTDGRDGLTVAALVLLGFILRRRSRQLRS